MVLIKKLSIVLSFLICTTVLQADAVSRGRYLALMQKYPQLVLPLGDASQGEIEIVTDAEQMERIERQAGRDIGVLKEDRYWIWVNDACRFPNGKEGVYGRILWLQGLKASVPAVAVMPVTTDGKVVLNCNFRHATRSWEIELPRGLVNQGETAEEAARREAAEETGRRIAEIRLLGETPPDTGVLSVALPIFIAKVAAIDAQQLEDSEAIEDVLELSFEEIKLAFAQGYYECKLRGEWRQVPFRDPFLAYALLRCPEEFLNNILSNIDTIMEKNNEKHLCESGIARRNGRGSPNMVSDVNESERRDAGIAQ